MSVGTKVVVSATVSETGKKILLRGRYSSRFVEFVHTLPDAKWRPNHGCWTVTKTPATAWRLMNHSGEYVEADEQILEAASRFAEAIKDSTDGLLTQPSIRRTNLWRHQLRAYRFACAHEAAMLAMEMGTGKSRVVVDFIVNQGMTNVLILCPVSVMGVWRREFEQWSDKKILVLDNGGVKEKTKTAKEWTGVVVINYESAWRSEFGAYATDRQWDLVVLDESHRVKSHNSKIGKFVGELTASRRLALTGTPMPHSPLDLFSQFRFLDRGIYGSSFHHFRSRYAKMNQIFPGKVDQWLNENELKERFSLLAFHVGTEVLDLPPTLDHQRWCNLSPKAARVYTDLETELIADIGSGVVTATNALTKLLRLQQVTCGFIVEDETEKVVELDDGKETLLAEIIDDLPSREPVVVFCRFKHDLRVVERVTEKLERRYGELSGSRKDGLTALATMNPEIDILGVQIQSGGVGIDLTRAAYAVYYSIGFSLGDILQSRARVHRPGQTRTTHYFHLLASGTVDSAIYGAIEKRKDLVESVMEALRK